MGARVWWMLTAKMSGVVPDVYHRFDIDTRRTLCGMQMPESYGRFRGTEHTHPMQVKLRCTKCHELNKIENTTKSIEKQDRSRLN